MFIKPGSVYNPNRIILLLIIKYWLAGRSCLALVFGTFLVTWRFLIAFSCVPPVPRPLYYMFYSPFLPLLSFILLSISWISFIKLLCSVCLCSNVHCVPAVELVVVGTLVGVQCASHKRSYRFLGAGHELSVNLISHYILIK